MLCLISCPRSATSWTRGSKRYQIGWEAVQLDTSTAACAIGMWDLLQVYSVASPSGATRPSEKDFEIGYITYLSHPREKLRPVPAANRPPHRGGATSEMYRGKSASHWPTLKPVMKRKTNSCGKLTEPATTAVPITHPTPATAMLSVYLASPRSILEVRIETRLSD
jgi:hypothetical protein